MLTKPQQIALQTFLVRFDDKLSFHLLLYKIACLDLDDASKHPEIELHSMYEETWKFLVAKQIEELEERLEKNFYGFEEVSK